MALVASDTKRRHWGKNTLRAPDLPQDCHVIARDTKHMPENRCLGPLGHTARVLESLPTLKCHESKQTNGDSSSGFRRF